MVDSSPSQSSRPLLDLFECFEGEVFDQSRNQVFQGGDLRRGRDQLLAYLLSRSVHPGEPVVMCVPNGGLFFSVLGALLSVAAAPVLLFGGATRAELERIAADCGARLAIGVPERAALVGVRPIIDLGDLGRCVCAEVPGVAHQAFKEIAGVPLHPTSGTTSGPKIAARPAERAVAEASHYVAELGIDRNDTILCTTPLSHAFAFGMCFAVPLLTSSRVVTSASFSPRAALRAVVERSATVLQAVPVMYDVFLRVWTDDLPAVRHAISAGAALPQATSREFERRSGVSIRSLYGTTETGGISIGPVGPVGGVGQPMRGVEVRLRPLDPQEYGRELGVVQVRSNSMMAGYFRGGRIDGSMLDDGWFETGDLAQLDAGGAIQLEGRESELINVFGMKVDPREVESTIATLEGVDEVLVYRGQHSGTEAVCAAVVSGVCDAETIRRHCQRWLSAYKCPTRIIFVSALPRTSSGKVVRRELPDNMSSS